MRTIHALAVTAKGYTWPETAKHKIVGGTVKIATQSAYAHAAIVLDFPDGSCATYEMLAPVITKTEGRVYSPENCEPGQYAEVTFEITDEAFDSLFAYLQFCLDKPVKYALWTGCLVAAIEAITHDALGNEAGQSVGNFLDENWSDRINDAMMCSELVTNCLRVTGLQLLPGLRAGAIPPDQYIEACFDLANSLAGMPS